MSIVNVSPHPNLLPQGGKELGIGLVFKSPLPWRERIRVRGQE